MTINLADNNPRISYTVASGVTQTSFTVPFEFFSDLDVLVYVDDVLKTITTDYTVSGGDGSTGTITMSVTGPAIVVLVREIPIERVTDFPTGIDINRAALNTQLDTLTAISADIVATANRSVLLSPTDTGSLTLPSVAARSGKFIAFDSSGDIETVDTVGDYRGNWSASTAYYRKDLVKDTTTGNVFICDVRHDSTGSLPITTNTDSAKWSLVLDIEAATDAQTAAEAAQTAAESAQSSAETAQTGAELAETNASTSEGNASTSETNASNSAAAAAASYDLFDDRFLGALASDPTLDNDGDALVEGALYFNSSSNEMRVYDGSAWLAAYVPSSTYITEPASPVNGDLLVRSGGAWARLAKGTADQVLVMNTGATAPEWADADTALPSAGALGSLCFAYSTSGDTGFGVDRAGSSLRPASATRSFATRDGIGSNDTAAFTVGSALTGTWKCLGNFDTTVSYAQNVGGGNVVGFTMLGATLWQRIL